MVALVCLLIGFAFFGAAITASILTRKHKKQAKFQSDYWQKYWYDHYYEIRQTGLTQEQMERMHRLYVSDGKSNDVSIW